MRAILLASATAASFFGLRANNWRSHGEARPGLAVRITAVAPSTRRRRRVSSPCRLILPGRWRPPVASSFGVMPSQAAKWRPERKPLGSVTFSEKLTAPIGPMPGWVARHWLTGSALCSTISSASSAVSLPSSASSCPANTPSISRARAGTPAASACACCSSSATLTRPLAAITPNSAAWPRIALITIVRCLTNRSRTLSSINAACCSALLIGTKRIAGRLIASQIAAASIASFLPRLTPAFAGAGAGLDVLRRQHHHGVPQATQYPGPVMRSTAGLQPDPGRRQLAEELRHLAAPQLTAQNRLFVLIDAVHLKDMLGAIQANPDNRHWAAPLLDCIITAWHYRCRRGPSTPTSYGCHGCRFPSSDPFLSCSGT